MYEHYGIGDNDERSHQPKIMSVPVPNLTRSSYFEQASLACALDTDSKFDISGASAFSVESHESELLLNILEMITVVCAIGYDHRETTDAADVILGFSNKLNSIML
ncbi:hypothetical protein Bbelb_154710 [Branchiostoma belcheri]|nr:hypothetical protein Bbelb_154710 [Branchiostoma belcheri]